MNADKYWSKAEFPYDVIIVPGVPYDNDEEWNNKVMRLRVGWAHYLYENGYAKKVMFSGSAVYTKYQEAIVFAKYAEKMGIKKEDIILECRAEHSTENIYYGYKLARKLGYEKIALASDPFQSKNLEGFAKRENLEVDYVPTKIDYVKSLELQVPELDTEEAIVDDFTSIVEREKFRKRWRGTLGKNINRSYYDSLDGEKLYLD